ncbi:MAG: phage tail protein [Bacteroidota bacterium]
MSTPIGSVIMYASETHASNILNLAMDGWLVCDGSKYSRTGRYSKLFGAIGESYGGDGTNFAVPSYKGLFIRGVDGDTGRDPDADKRDSPRPNMPNSGNKGLAVGSLESDDFEGHNHAYNEYNALHKCDHVAAHHCINKGSTTTNTTSTGGSETRPVNIYINFLIKYTDEFDVVPPGAVIPFSGTKAMAENLLSDGWLFCDGNSYSVSQYNVLFNIIENYYGADSENNMFNVPDYRGLFLRGVQGTLLPGQTSPYDPDNGTRTAPSKSPQKGNIGNSVGSVQATDIRSHTHTYQYNNDNQKTAATAIGFHGVASDRGDSTLATNSMGGAESRPKNVNVNYLIYSKSDS